MALSFKPTIPLPPLGRHVLKPGTPEHRNTGTPEHRNTGTPEHSGTPRNTPEHPGTPEQSKKPGTPNLAVLFCFPITDHVKK